MLYSFYKDELPFYGNTRRKDEKKNKVFDCLVISGIIGFFFGIGYFCGNLEEI
tara:strand:- start:2000 stop:2158 length:159 start_codon:yes stop_codon:yes gene_type:complete